MIKTRRAVRVSGGGSDPKNNKEDREGWFRYVSRRESKGETKKGSIYLRGNQRENQGKIFITIFLHSGMLHRGN